MPTDDSAAQPTKATRSSRTSIRHSLNLASVGKALADVMNKDGKDAESRRSAKMKETHSRRLSAIALPSSRDTPTGRITQHTVTKSVAKNTPDSKTITRATRAASSTSRATTSSQDELGVRGDLDTPQQAGTLTRATSVLRPRNTPASSALPKYRPKSPVRAGVRRKHNSSEEERDPREARTPTSESLQADSPEGRCTRPISPIPRRAAAKVTLMASTSSSPSLPFGKEKTTVRSPPANTSTPTRPRKTAKPSSPTSKASVLPRPASSSPSRNTSRTIRTPTPVGNLSPHVKVAKGPSPLRSNVRNDSPSPLSRCSHKADPTSPVSVVESNASSSTMSPTSFTDEVSVDSIDAGDVEFMLATVVSPTAPTPALPRIRSMAHTHRMPQTPSRSSTHLLPTRANMSYLSPLPRYANDISPSKESRRPGKDRGSLLSWEQLAADTSTNLGEVELGSMISEISAPFTPGLVSPSPSVLQLEGSEPVSPSPHQLPSPGGFTSISQVLLPNVTPSPAVHGGLHHFDNSADIPEIDAALVTLLRLQLASSENVARERLDEIGALKERLESVQQACLRDERDMTVLERHMHETIAEKELLAERAGMIHQLEEQLRDADVLRQRAVQEAVDRAREESLLERECLLRKAEGRHQLSCAIREVSESWSEVLSLADGERELTHTNREMLAVILADLESRQATLLRDHPA